MARLALWIVLAALVVTTLAVPAFADSRVQFLADRLRYPPAAGQADDFRVRANAALALGSTDDDGAMAPLCAGLSDPNDAVRQRRRGPEEARAPRRRRLPQAPALGRAERRREDADPARPRRARVRRRRGRGRRRRDALRVRREVLRLGLERREQHRPRRRATSSASSAGPSPRSSRRSASTSSPPPARATTAPRPSSPSARSRATSFPSASRSSTTRTATCVSA